MSGQTSPDPPNYEMYHHAVERHIGISMLQSPVLGVTATDLEGTLVYMNKRFEERYQLSASDYLGKPFIRTVHPEDVDVCNLAAERCMRSPGKIEVIEIRKPDPAGGFIWTEWQFTAMMSPEGEMLGIVCVGDDITANKRAEKQLEGLAQFPKGAFAPILSVHETGRLDFHNQAAESLLQEWQVSLGDRVPDALMAHLRESFQSNSSVVFDLTVGNTPYVMSASPFIDSGIAYIYAADVSHMRQLESQLRQAQKLEAVGQLASGVAHHFNNILTALIGYADLSLDALAHDHPAREDVHGILDTARRASSITNQLLAFTRQQINQPRVQAINEVIRSFEGLLRQLISQAIEINLSLEPDAGSVKVDAGQIEQVLVNLVVNARDAMPDGGRITISTRKLVLEAESPEIPLSPGTYVEVSVADDGIGMSREIQQRIFEPFYTTKPAGKGTGLGLAMTLGIVEQNEGHISVTSDLNRGTRFQILLPHVEGSTPLTPTKTSSVAEGSGRVLVVEDDDAVRNLAKRFLMDKGYTVEIATDGVEALERLQSGLPFDLILTDLEMPRLGGFQLFDRCRSLNLESRWLFISGDPRSHYDRSEERKSDDLPLLRKPFTRDELLLKIREVLSGSPKARPEP